MSAAPRRRGRAIGAALALALPLLAPAAPECAASGPVPATPLECTRRLAAELKRSGRAEATLVWNVEGPPGVAASRRSGTLALEPPSLARLDVAATGDRVTLRADGGEWLQPGLRQLIKLSPRHAGAAMRWWRLLAGGEGARERRLGRGGYRLVVAAGGGPGTANRVEADSAEVWLDARGLPARLVLDDGAGGRQAYTLHGWRFTRAKGAAAFRLAAPVGIEVVELP